MKKGIGIGIGIGIALVIVLLLIFILWGNVMKQKSEKPLLVVTEETTISSTKPPASREFRSALKMAQSYIDNDSFSKQKLYDQLTSQDGSNFSVEAAQYAIDHVKVDYNEEALEAAQSYVNSRPFSEQGLYDQLTSEYGENFSAEEAQYAINHVNVDYNEEALEAALYFKEDLLPRMKELNPNSLDLKEENLKETLAFSLTSVDKFTEEQVSYAISKLFD